MEPSAIRCLPLLAVPGEDFNFDPFCLGPQLLRRTFERAGLEQKRVIATPSPYSLIEAVAK